MPGPPPHFRLDPCEPRLLLAVTPIAELNAREPTFIPPLDTAVIGPDLYFTVRRTDVTAELWRSDGTPAGTRLVKSITTASGTSNPAPDPLVQLTTVGQRLYFIVNEPAGVQLWRSDGTDAGTARVHTFTSTPSFSSDYQLTDVNGRLFFVNSGLYVSDDAGTRLLKSGSINELESHDGRLVFSTSGGLWTSDGTAANTVQISTLTQPRHLRSAGDTLYFAATHPTSGEELYKTDPTTANGATLVKEINPGVAGAQIDQLTVLGDAVYFTAYDGNSTELYRSDGTDPGTTIVKDITPNAWELLENLTAVGNTLFFQASIPGPGRELWATDGTPEGTRLVKDIRPGPSHSDLAGLTAFGQHLYFHVRDDAHGRELWRSDGTEAGTTLVHDLYPGPAGSIQALLAVAPDRLFFQGTHPVTGTGLFATDGATEPTLLYDLVSGPLSPTAEIHATPDGTIYFTADGLTPTGQALYKSDGTPAGTSRVTGLTPTVNPSTPAWLTAVGNTLYFSAGSFPEGIELWRTDGTPDGTRIVRNITTTPGARDANPENLTNVNGTLFFSANANNQGIDLWKSDGTEAGTVMVRDLTYADIGSFTPMNGALFYTSQTGTSLNGGLYRSDGTSAGTTLLRGFTSIGNLTTIDGALYFAANGGEGAELWKSNGTAAGTVLLKDIYPGAQSGRPNEARPLGMTAFKGAIYFSAFDGINGREIWRSDGTPGGTALFKDLAPGQPGTFSPSSNPSSFHVVNDTLVFIATTGGVGAELWRSDGTAAGTVPLLDINPGPATSAAQDFVLMHGRLYFTADDGLHGRELWVTDGTPDGTRRVTDLNPGPTSANPLHLTAIDGALYFTANDGVSPKLFKLAGPQLELRDSYFVSPEWQLTLDATGGVTPEGGTTFAWDLDADGLFGETGPAAARGDETGAVATFSSAGLTPGTYDVALRAADSLGLATVATTTVTVGPPPGVTASDGARYHLSGTPSAPMFTLARGHAAVGRALTDSLADLAIHVADDALITLSPSADGRYRLRALTLEPTAFFDIFDNDLILAAPSAERDALMAALAAHVHAGRVGASAPPAYTGVALFPSRPDQDTILVKHTYNGDANADGRINADDYFRIDQAFLAQPASPTYAQGDFNYDARVNADDYFLIDQAFLGQGAPLTGSGDSTPLLPTRATVEDARRRRVKRARPTPRAFD